MIGFALVTENLGPATTHPSPVALVTGAFSGIGLASALALRDAGFRVYATGRDPRRAPSALTRARADKPDVAILAMDVTDPRSVAEAFARVDAESGRLDVLVNNAGYGVFGAVTSATDEHVQSELETNVVGAIRATRAALAIMARQSGGRIIQVGSAVGRMAIPGMGTYVATKFALAGFNDGLAFDLMTLGPGFHTSIIEPAQVRTNFVAKTVYPATTSGAPFAGFSEHFRALFEATNPAAPGPEGVARAVVQAATAWRPKARYIVGWRPRGFLLARALLPERLFRRLLYRAFRMGDIPHIARQPQGG